jgi:hypothetical protein
LIVIHATKINGSNTKDFSLNQVKSSHIDSKVDETMNAISILEKTLLTGTKITENVDPPKLLRILRAVIFSILPQDNVSDNTYSTRILDTVQLGTG